MGAVRSPVTTAGKPRRVELARRAAEEAWSSRDLKAEVEAGSDGPRFRGGWPGRWPKGPLMAMREPIGLCDKLHRDWEAVEGQALRSWVAGPPTASTGTEARGLVDEAVAKLDEMQAMVQRVARQLRRVGEARSPAPDAASGPKAEPGIDRSPATGRERRS